MTFRQKSKVLNDSANTVPIQYTLTHPLTFHFLFFFFYSISSSIPTRGPSRLTPAGATFGWWWTASCRCGSASTRKPVPKIFSYPRTTGDSATCGRSTCASRRATCPGRWYRCPTWPSCTRCPGCRRCPPRWPKLCKVSLWGIYGCLRTCTVERG